MTVKAKAEKSKKTEKTGGANGRRKKQAFSAPRTDTFKINPFDLVILGVDTSDPAHEHDLFMLLHKHRIMKPLEEDMLASIKEGGVELAITTAKVWLPAGMTLRGRVLKEEEQHIIAVDGRRRTLHTRHLCVEAGDKDGTKKTYVIKVMPPKVGYTIRELAGLAVELNETSRHDDVLEKAGQAFIMFNRTQDKTWVASKFHVDVQTIDGWFKLRANAAPAVIDAVRTKKLGATAATKLSALPPKRQIEVMEEAIASGKTSTKQIDGMAKRKIAEVNGVKPSERPDVTPSKRQLTACIGVIDDSDLDIEDEFVTREKAWVELLKWVTSGVVSSKAIADLDKKSKERMETKRSDGDTRVQTAVAAAEK